MHLNLDYLIDLCEKNEYLKKVIHVKWMFSLYRIHLETGYDLYTYFYVSK